LIDAVLASGLVIIAKTPWGDVPVTIKVGK
jgi:hypothetical protein